MSQSLRGNFEVSFSPSGSFIWQNLPIGGGGFVTGLAVHTDGTIIIRGDGYGTVVSTTNPNTAASPWQTALTATSMPSGYYTTPYLGGGGYEVAIDPSNSSNLWWYYCPISGATLSSVLKSTNKGHTWTATGFALSAADSNTGDASRTNCGQRIAVDPNNSNVVYVGDINGLYVTTNGGISFSSVSGVPAPTASDYGICAIKFDPTSGTTGGMTNRIIVGVNGKGLYYTTNAGSTWNGPVSGAGTDFGHGYIGSDGTYYYTQGQSQDNLYRFATDNSTITNLGNMGGNDVAALAIDPGNPAHAIAFNPQNNFGTFSAAINTGSPTLTTASGAVTSDVTDSPWQQTLMSNTNAYQSISDVAWDPLLTSSAVSQTIASSGTFTFNDLPSGLNITAGDAIRVSNTGTPTNYMLGTVTSYRGTTLVLSVGSVAPGGYLGSASGGSGTYSAWTITKERIWIAWGFGVFYVDAPSPSNGSVVKGKSFGFEMLAARKAIWPPVSGASSGYPMLCTYDIAEWCGVNNPIGATSGSFSGFGPTYNWTLSEGSNVDWASADPSYAVLTVNSLGKSYYNSSAGQDQDWTQFTSQPTSNPGMAAAASSTNIVIGDESAGGYYTTNGGASWSACSSLPSVGWGNGSNQICADRVNTGTFYAVDFTDGGNIWKSTNSGATWTEVATGIGGDDGYLAKMECVIGQAGHIFLTPAEFNIGSDSTLADVVNGHPTTLTFQFSSNGGTTWGNVVDVLEVLTFATGAAKPGGNGYPSIYIAGWVNNGSGYQYGIWRGDNFNTSTLTATWTYLGAYPSNNLGGPCAMAADPANWGRVIVGFQGSGFVIGETGSPSWP